MPPLGGMTEQDQELGTRHKVALQNARVDVHHCLGYGGRVSFHKSNLLHLISNPPTPLILNTPIVVYYNILGVLNPGGGV